MSFAFPDIDPNTQGAVYDVPVPLSRYLDNMYESGKHHTILQSLNRMSEMSVADADETSPILQPKEAQEKWGVGNLKFDQPVRDSVARLMNQRKRDEMDREFFIGQGASKMRFAPGMASAMFGSMSNPVDIAVMFIPFVGEEAAAAKATGTFGRIAARRLITREALQTALPKASGLAESMINGMAGQALFEVPVLASALQDQSNYSAKDSVFNIAAGGAFAAAMHGAGVLYKRLSRGTKDVMARQALNQILNDEQIKVHDYVKVDENAIWSKIRFDEDAALQKAYDNVNMDIVAEAVRAKYGETVKSPAVKMVDGSIHEGPSHESITNALYEKDPNGYKLEEEGFVTDKGRFISREEAGQLVGLPDKGYNHLMWENDKLMSEQINTTNPEQLGTAEFDRYNQLIEENPQLSKVETLRKIMEERERRRDRYLMSLPHIQEKLEVERKIAIEQFIANERSKFEQQKQGLFDAEKQKEIDSQIAAGKTMPPEEVQKRIPPEKFEEAGTEELDAEINALQEALKEDADEMSGLTREELMFKEQAKTDSIKAATDCILKKVI